MLRKFRYHSEQTETTCEECNTDKELNNVNNKSKTLLDDINKYSETLKELREEVKGVEKNAVKEEGTVTGAAANFNDSFEDNKKQVSAKIKEDNLHDKDADLYDIMHPLQKRINENAIKNKIDFTEKVEFLENVIESSKSPLFGKAAMSTQGTDAAGLLNIAEGKNIPVYLKDSIKTTNIDSQTIDDFNKGDLKKWKPYMTSKIQDQFRDFNYETDGVEGYIFKDNSALVKRIKNSNEFKRILNENKNAILKGERFSGAFNKDKDENLHKAFGKVDLLNSGFDKDGNLHLYVFDTYDFNKGENALVEAGRRQMLKGNLKGFFTVCEIIIKKEELKQYGL